MTYELLITLSPGPVFRFATRAMLLQDADGKKYQYVGVLRDADFPTIGEDGTSVQVTIPISFFDFRAMRANGIWLGGADAEVAIIRSDATELEDRIVLVVGRVVPTSERRSRENIEFEIAAAESQMDGPLPPWILGDGSFGIGLTLPSSAKGQTIPVVRGNCTEVPLIPLYNFNVPQETGIPTDIPFIVCGHSIASDRVLVKLDGQTGTTYQAALTTYTDPVSGAIATIALIPRDTAGSYSSFVAEVRGPLQANGTALDGLGDVILDLIRTFGKIPESRIDFDRFSRFLYRANRIRVASVFGGGQEMAISTIQSRYGGMPISVSWRGGRIGADWLAFDYSLPVTRTLTFEKELLDRFEPVEVDGDPVPYSEFSLAYDYNIGQETFRKFIRVDEANDERCRRVYRRFGAVRYPEISLVDVNVEQAARSVLDATIDLHAVNRRRVAYLADFEIFRQLPLLDRFAITDADMEWEAESFRLETIRPRRDGRCAVTFRSYRDAAYV